MDVPLLQTKLYRPVTRSDPAEGIGTRLIPRPRLIERLNQGLSGKLTLISAPAGFGKTTLVSAWLDQLKHPVAWLSLDEEDNDPARFLTYCIAALQTIQPEVGTEVLAMLQSLPVPSSHTLLTLLINDLTALSEKSLLVLDDYHTIEKEAIHQALTFFIDHMPPIMHLVMTTRVDPNLPLARMRVQAQLNELRSGDLRFTQRETTQFLEQMSGLSLTPAYIAALDRRTEGWIAGLQMAALSLRQREAGSVAHFIEDFSGSHHYVMNYLVDEVLRRQPTEVQTFLLYTSILDQLCGPLCAAILRGSELSDRDRDSSPVASKAQELLTYLEHANLFLNPLDDQHFWYRYHPLFAELLRHRLEQTYPDQVTSLHLSASRWYEQEDLTGPAVKHALAAQAFDRAATLLEQVTPAMIQRSELAKLLIWLDALPDEEIQARPRLALYYGWVLFLTGQNKQAATQLKATEAMLTVYEAKQTPDVEGYAAATRAYLARLAGDFTATITLSRKALGDLPEHNLLLRDMVAFNLAIAHYFQGEFGPASQLLAQIIANGQAVQRTGTALWAIHINTQLLKAQGALQEALRLCQEGLELAGRHGWRLDPAVGALHVNLGDISRERNELGTAEEYLRQGIGLGQAADHARLLITGHVWLAWLRQTQKDMTGSQESIQTALQLDQRHEGSWFWPLPSPACFQARLWIAQGDLPGARRWAQARGLNQVDPLVSFLHEAEYLTLARLLIAQEDLEAVEALLLRLHEAAATAGRGGSLIEILILQAITFAAQKRTEEALSALAQALSLAEPEGYVRIFLDEGAPVVELLRRAVARDLHTSYALRLLNAVGETAVARPQPLIEPLSERELEVIRRVAAGYSNQEIAQDLVVAVSTVKKHVNSIYRKLEVGSRTQATAKARELGLL